MKNLVLLSYGKEKEFNRTILAVLSYFSWRPHRQGTRVIIYTDQYEYFKGWFEDFPIEYVQLTPSMLAEMLGGTDYIHRRKICVIDETFRKYPEDDQLYIDSDTFFIGNPDIILDRIGPDSSFMHLHEYTIEDGVQLYKKYMNHVLPNADSYPRKFIELVDNETFSIGGIDRKFSRKNSSWNAGVLGLPKEFSGYLQDVFSFSDRAYQSTKWSISEQLAFTFVIGSVTRIQPADKVVHHYHPMKGRVDELINTLLVGDFKMIPTENKLKRVRKFTISASRLLDHEQCVSITMGSLRNHNYRKAGRFALKAVWKLPLGLELIRYSERRFCQMKAKLFNRD